MELVSIYSRVSSMRKVKEYKQRLYDEKLFEVYGKVTEENINGYLVTHAIISNVLHGELESINKNTSYEKLHKIENELKSILEETTHYE